MRKGLNRSMADLSTHHWSLRKATRQFLSTWDRALGIGFAGLLLLMAAMAFDATTSLRRVELATAALRNESRARDALLDQLRADIFRTATVVRDYLLDVDGARADGQKAELQALRARIGQTLLQYEAKLPLSERDTFRDLRSHVDSYWWSLEPSLQWDAKLRRAKAGSFLLDVILPFRTEVLQLTRRITALNERDLDAGEERIRAVQSGFRRRVAVISLSALLLGLILATLSIRRVQRLEREAQARYEEVEAARREMQTLSSRLVTAQEEERRNLSRELHDEVGQTMSAMLVELGRLESSPDAETRGERLKSVRGLAETSVGMVRNMALLLRPSMLDDLGLVAALRWQAREVTRRSGLKVKMVADEIVEDLPDSHRTCVYRVVQEALNNCTRHAQATQVRVVVRRDEQGLSVTVQDDGIGFDPRREKGMGLLGMEERVDQLGGRFSIDSASGHGAVLSILLPLDGAARQPTKDTI
ncbi:sensor histidine kinase [uncultured Paludibaculum sp.]|uniref:sensor histidine kinase n=1 Tax=uncultured Paludibaculum sp. TaxID=1765020 RepID=UPI002AAAA189|nr:sensor histidine kinase [uncultured Paludibaculum sp.]